MSHVQPSSTVAGWNQFESCEAAVCVIRLTEYFESMFRKAHPVQRGLSSDWSDVRRRVPPSGSVDNNNHSLKQLNIKLVT